MFDPTTLPGYIAGPVDWDSPWFGSGVHAASYIDAERGEEQ